MPDVRSLMDSLPDSACRPILRVRVRAPPSDGRARRPGAVMAGGPFRLRHAAMHGISQVPGRSILYVCRALRSRPSPRRLAWRRHGYCPRVQQNEDPSSCMMSRLNRTAFVPAVYASRTTSPSSMQDSLPVGCSPLPGGSRTLWIATKGFGRLHCRSPFPGLAWR